MRLSRNKVIGLIVIVILIIVGFIVWLLIRWDQGSMDNKLSEKVNEFKDYGNNYTLEEAKEDEFYVEETISEGAPEEMIRFIESI